MLECFRRCASKMWGREKFHEESCKKGCDHITEIRVKYQITKDF